MCIGVSSEIVDECGAPWLFVTRLRKLIEEEADEVGMENVSFARVVLRFQWPLFVLGTVAGFSYILFVFMGTVRWLIHNIYVLSILNSKCMWTKQWLGLC